MSPILVTLASHSDSNSNDRTSASKTMNRMVFIRTLTASTVAFEKNKEKLYGFQQIE